MLDRQFSWLILISLFSFSVNAQTQPNLKAEEPNVEVKLMKMNLEKQLRNDIENRFDSLEKGLLTEVREHRTYLQTLNDRFYNRIQFWLPVLSAITALIIALFLWRFGTTQKEAYEYAKILAVQKATILAEEKVAQVIIPDEIIASSRAAMEAGAEQVEKIKEAIVKNSEEELNQARDKILKDKEKIIIETIDEAIKNNFEKEFDLMARIKDLEGDLKEIRSKLNDLQNKLKKEDFERIFPFTTKALSRSSIGSVSLDFLATLARVLKK